MNAILVMCSDAPKTKLLLEVIRSISPRRKLIITEDFDVSKHSVEEIEIVTGWVSSELLAQLTNLRWFQQWGAGADWLLHNPDLANSKFILTSASGLHAIPISEHIITLMLAFARDFPRAVHAQTRLSWEGHEPFNVFELAGKTMVLLGVGSIGARTAEVASSMGMRVIGIRRNAEVTAPGVEMMYDSSKMKDVLPQADFLVITAPYTAETSEMIGEKELRLLPTNSYIINIGRGGIIQETSLINALEKGWIAGAGLDVFETEPLPQDSPLWKLENVIITPHYAGKTPHYVERAIEIFIDNLRRYEAGEPMFNVVDKYLGY